MLALVYDGEPRLRADYNEPRPAAGEALLGVRVAGVCRTDLEVVKGYMGFTGVMGHEFVGQVLQGPSEWRGRRVVAEINCPCGRCELCARELGNHCPNRGVLGIDKRDGVFAERVAVPVANLHEIPDGVSDDEAVFVEPLAAAFQMLRQVQVTPEDRVVVLGDGRLAQLIVRVLKAHRPTAADNALLIVGKHAEKLRYAERQGIATRLAGDFAPDRRADVVVDATGTAGGFELAMRTVCPRGTIVLKSTFAAGEGFNLAPLVIDEITVVGSRCGPFEEAIAALAAPAGSPRRVEVGGDLVSRRFGLSDGLAALDAAADGRNLKVLLDVGV